MARTSVDKLRELLRYRSRHSATLVSCMDASATNRRRHSSVPNLSQAVLLLTDILLISSVDLAAERERVSNLSDVPPLTQALPGMASTSFRRLHVLSRVKRTVLGGIALGALTVLIMPGAAFASAGTATFTAGDLTMNAPATVAFTATLSGIDQAVNAHQSIDVLDNTGSGAGWNVTLTSTTFTQGSFTLPTDAVSKLAGAIGGCDTTVSCTLADNVSGAGVVAIPSAPVTAPTAVKILNASVDTGLGGQSWDNTMQLAVPANARAGAYTSTWTYSVVSAP